VLTSGATVGDVVDIVAYAAFELANVYTQAQSDVRYAQRANNLSDLANTATARTNLGLGTAATQNTGTFLQTANNLSDVTAATARTNLGLAIGTNVQAWDADLDTWATKTAPSGTVVGTSDSQTLTNKTLTTPVLTTPNITTGLLLNSLAGTSGQILTSAGSGFAPTWQTPAASGPTSIELFYFANT
jgi:hypothetical protein